MKTAPLCIETLKELRDDCEKGLAVNEANSAQLRAAKLNSPAYWTPQHEELFGATRRQCTRMRRWITEIDEALKGVADVAG